VDPTCNSNGQEVDFGKPRGTAFSLFDKPFQYKYWTKDKKSGVVTYKWCGVVTYSNTTTETAVELLNLISFPEYSFEIIACNVFDNKGDGCDRKRLYANIPSRRSNRRRVSATYSDIRIVPLGSGGVILDLDWFLNYRVTNLVIQEFKIERKDDLLAYCKH
jgi:hypothetical protein